MRWAVGGSGGEVRIWDSDEPGWTGECVIALGMDGDLLRRSEMWRCDDWRQSVEQLTMTTPGGEDGRKMSKERAEMRGRRVTCRRLAGGKAAAERAVEGRSWRVERLGVVRSTVSVRMGLCLESEAGFDICRVFGELTPTRRARPIYRRPGEDISSDTSSRE